MLQSITAMAKINKSRWLLHAPCSLDLAPSDFFLFPNLKKWLDVKRFANNEEVASTVEDNVVKLYFFLLRLF